MKKVNMEQLLELPKARISGASMMEEKKDVKTSFFSKKIALIAGAFMLSLQLMSSNARAQDSIAHYTATNGTGTTVVYAANATGTSLTPVGLGTNSACGSGGLSGLTNNGVTTFSTSNGHVYFTITANPGYVLNITGYHCKLRRSASGIQKVRMAYVTTGGVVNDLVDKAPDNTGCGGGTDVYNWNTTTGGSLPTGVTSFTAELFPYAPVSSGGTIQFNDIAVIGTVAVNPVSCPSTIAGGTVTPSATTVCGGTSVALSLSGYSTGSAIGYQWQSSPTGTSSWTSIPGATTTSYSVPASYPSSATTTYYQAITTCAVSSVSATSSDAAVTVDFTPSAGAITGSIVLTEGASTTLTNATATTGADFVGVWNSSNTSVATIDPLSGFYSAITPGVTTIGYTVTDITTGCNASASVNGGVIYPGTLATYIGSGGTSTSVIGITGETVSALSATGFGSNSPCSSGGLSGLTVPTTVVTYSPTAPHITYTIAPTTGNALNVYGFWIKSRSSGTGPDSAILAYSTDGVTWTTEPASHHLSTTGSCGANTNTWHWVPSAAITGITSNFMIAVFPFHPASGSGTFQLNTLEVDGVISSSTLCSGTPAAGVITPSVSVACDSGYASLSFSSDSGVGISSVWESSTDGGVTFNPIAGASNATYISPVYYPTTSIIYEVVTTCSNGGGTAVSTQSTFSVTPQLPAITGAPSPYLYVNQTVTLSDAISGGTWESSHFSIGSVDAVSGAVTGLIAGITVVSYNTTGFHCYVTDTISVIDSNSIAIYLGTGGNSTATVSLVPASATVSSLTATGFGTNTLCSEGGLSGMTVSTTVGTYDPSNPNAGFVIAPISGSGLFITGIHSTIRSSNSGPQTVVIAYSSDGGSTWTTSAPLSADIESCGVSTVDVNYILPTPLNTTSNVYVAIYPYAPLSSAGTFQVNALDVTGYACGNVGTIMDLNPLSSGTLNGETYNINCFGTSLSCTPAGGTWAADPADIASVDMFGNLTFNPSYTSAGTLTVTYTDACATSVSTATVTVSSDPSVDPICDGNARHAAPTTVTSVSNSQDVSIYPNPAAMMLNIAAAGPVNVSVLSMDGRMLLSQKNTKSVDISNLASGVYMIQVYNSDNSLIKTAKFTKE